MLSFSLTGWRKKAPLGPAALMGRCLQVMAHYRRLAVSVVTTTILFSAPAAAMIFGVDGPNSVGGKYPGGVGSGGVSMDGIAGFMFKVYYFLQGPTATLMSSVAMLGVLYGMIVKAQRGESVNSLLTIAIAILIVTSMDEFLSLIGINIGLIM